MAAKNQARFSQTAALAAAAVDKIGAGVVDAWLIDSPLPLPARFGGPLTVIKFPLWPGIRAGSLSSKRL